MLRQSRRADDALVRIWVRLTRENFEALKAALTQLVLWQHTRDSAAQNLLRFRLQHRLVRNFLQAAGVHGVVAIHLLVRLAARNSDVRRIRHNNIVARIHRRIVDWLVLAHQRHGDRARKTAKYALTRIHMVPQARKRQRRLVR